MLLKKKYHPLGENCKKKLIFLKSYIFLHRNDTLLNHNSHAENTARSYMQERGECVSWVYRRQKVSPKFLWQGLKSGSRSGWASISIPSVSRRSESDAIGLEWPTKEAVCLDPRGPFCAEGFLLFICISLISSVFEKEHENEQRRHVASWGLFGWNESANSCFSHGHTPTPPGWHRGRKRLGTVVFFTESPGLGTGPDTWQAFSKYLLNELTELVRTLSVIYISACLKCSLFPPKRNTSFTPISQIL